MSFNSISFGDSVQMISGKTPSKQNPDFWNGDVPWISASSMDKLYVSSSSEKITQKALNESGIKYIEAGTPLLLVRGSILHQRIPISIPTKKVTINQDVKALKLKNDILDPDYFIAWLLASERLLLEKVEFTGIGAGKLDTEVLNKLSIPCPQRKHQVFIGQLTKALNQKIELNNQINETLESMAKAIFKEWFIDFGPVKAKAEGKKPFGMDDETATLFPDRFEESELGMIPTGWEVIKINDISEISSGKRPQLRADIKSSEAPYPILGGGGVMGYTNDFLVESKHLATGRVGTLGKIFRVAEKTWPSDNTLLIKPRIEIYKHFLYFSLCGINFLSLNRGSTQPLLTQSDLGNQKFVAPKNRNLIERYNSTVSALFQKIDGNNEETLVLIQTRDLLLPKLISGELQLSEVTSD